MLSPGAPGKHLALEPDQTPIAGPAAVPHYRTHGRHYTTSRPNPYPRIHPSTAASPYRPQHNHPPV